MTQLLILKEHIQKFYQKYSLIINPLFRFLAGCIIFYAANRAVGYNPALGHNYVIGILSVITVVFPPQMVLFIAALYVVLHILYVSKYLALVTGVVFAILYLIYIRFLPKHGYIIMSVPVLFAFNVPYALPVLMGLVSTPVVIIPIGIGVIVYYMLQTIVSVVGTSTDDAVNLYHAVLQQLYSNLQMYSIIVIFSIVLIVVYIIRNREKDFSFEIAILTGTILNLVLIFISNYILDISVNILYLIVGVVLSAVIVWIIQFFRLSLNYEGVENLQFEDEEYYYYVRAVPKTNIAAASKRVKRFNAHHFSETVSYIEEEGVKKFHNAFSGKKEKKNQELDHDFKFKVSIDEDDLDDENH